MGELTVEEAIAEVEGYIINGGRDLPAALRRIALAAYESMPCFCGEWYGDCFRCRKVQEYSA